MRSIVAATIAFALFATAAQAVLYLAERESSDHVDAMYALIDIAKGSDKKFTYHSLGQIFSGNSPTSAAHRKTCKNMGAIKYAELTPQLYKTIATDAKNGLKTALVTRLVEAVATIPKNTAAIVAKRKTKPTKATVDKDQTPLFSKLLSKAALEFAIVTPWKDLGLGKLAVAAVEVGAKAKTSKASRLNKFREGRESRNRRRRSKLTASVAEHSEHSEDASVKQKAKTKLTERFHIVIYCNHGACPGDPGMELICGASRFHFNAFAPRRLTTCDEITGYGDHVCNSDTIMEKLSWHAGEAVEPDQDICQTVYSKPSCNRMVNQVGLTQSYDENQGSVLPRLTDDALELKIEEPQRVLQTAVGLGIAVDALTATKRYVKGKTDSDQDNLSLLAKGNNRLTDEELAAFSSQNEDMFDSVVTRARFQGTVEEFFEIHAKPIPLQGFAKKVAAFFQKKNVDRAVHSGSLFVQHWED
jgi:hypothetical protein